MKDLLTHDNIHETNEPCRIRYNGKRKKKRVALIDEIRNCQTQSMTNLSKVLFSSILAPYL